MSSFLLLPLFILFSFILLSFSSFPLSPSHLASPFPFPRFSPSSFPLISSFFSPSSSFSPFFSSFSWQARGSCWCLRPRLCDVLIVSLPFPVLYLASTFSFRWNNPVFYILGPLSSVRVFLPRRPVDPPHRPLHPVSVGVRTVSSSLPYSPSLWAPRGTQPPRPHARTPIRTLAITLLHVREALPCRLW